VNRRRAAEAGLIVNVIIWGATFVVVKAALRDVSPILFIALRFTLATAVLLALASLTFGLRHRLPITRGR